MNNVVKNDTDSFVTDSYSTLCYSIAIVLVTLFIFYRIFPESIRPPRYLNSGRQNTILIVSAMILFASLVLSFTSSHDRNVFGRARFTISAKWRRRLLPASVLATLFCLGLIVFATGGGVSSPFSHYLIAAATLAIVLASKKRTQILMIAGALIILLISLPEVIALTPWLDYAPEGYRELVFECAILVGTVLVASIASWDYSPSQQMGDNLTK